MHDPRHAMQTFAWVWLGGVAVLSFYLLGKSMFGPLEERERARREIDKALGGNGWFLLSMTLKLASYAVPRLDHRVPWLWIPALVIAMVTWTLRGAKWIIERRARLRPQRSSYTRSLRKAARRERSLIRRS